MWGILVAAVLAYGLVRAAAPRSESRQDADRRRLLYLITRPPKALTRDEAADGVVLARKFKQPALEKVFSHALAKRR